MDRDKVLRIALWPFDDDSINRVLSDFKKPPMANDLQKKQKQGYGIGTREVRVNNGVRYMGSPGGKPYIGRQMSGEVEYPDSAQPSETAVFLARK